MEVLCGEDNPEASSYDLVIGRDLMHEIGIDICFGTTGS
jgi:hypothetical protein